MKKKFKLYPCIFILAIYLTGCNWNTWKQPCMQPDSVWVCKEPEMTYYVVGTAGEEGFYDYVIAKINGKKVLLTVGFQSTVVGLARCPQKCEDNIKKTLMQTSIFTMSGVCKYYKDRFIVTVSTDADELFHGKYNNWTFEKVTPENEGELNPLTPDDWDVEWDEGM